MKIEQIQKDIAKKIINYEKNIDYYEFDNNYKNEKEAFNDILETLRNSNGIIYILEMLNNDIRYYEKLYKINQNDCYVNRVLKEGKNLYNEIKEYQDSMVKMEKGR